MSATLDPVYATSTTDSVTPFKTEYPKKAQLAVRTLILWIQPESHTTRPSSARMSTKKTPDWNTILINAGLEATRKALAAVKARPPAIHW